MFTCECMCDESRMNRRGFRAFSNKSCGRRIRAVYVNCFGTNYNMVLRLNGFDASLEIADRRWYFLHPNCESDHNKTIMFECDDFAVGYIGEPPPEPEWIQLSFTYDTIAGVRFKS